MYIISFNLAGIISVCNFCYGCWYLYQKSRLLKTHICVDLNLGVLLSYFSYCVYGNLTSGSGVPASDRTKCQAVKLAALEGRRLRRSLVICIGSTYCKPSKTRSVRKLWVSRIFVIPLRYAFLAPVKTYIIMLTIFVPSTNLAGDNASRLKPLKEVYVENGVGNQIPHRPPQILRDFRRRFYLML